MKANKTPTPAEKPRRITKAGWKADAVVMLEVFLASIQNMTVPSPCSPCRKMLDEILDASGMRAIKRKRMPKRSEIGAAFDGMANALQAVADCNDANLPKDIAAQVRKALALHNAARVDFGRSHPQKP
jgi:hypothetical protein